MSNVDILNGYLLPPEEQQALLDGPAIPTPEGAVSHFGEPIQISTGILFFISIALLLTTFFAAMRIYVRLVIIKSYSLAECLTIIAFVLLAGEFYVYYSLALEVGFYVHQWDISLRTLTRYLHLYYIGISLYSALVPTMKAAILLDWIKIFVPQKTRPAFYWICQVVLWVNVVLYLTTLILTQLVCSPTEYFWNPFIQGHCATGRAADVVATAFNSASDIIILVLPQTIIWRLRMTQERRLGIAAIFAIGIIACVASIVRVVYVVEYLYSDDQTYGGSPFLLWTLAEISIVFLVLCVPSSPKMFGKIPKALQFTITTLRSLLSVSWRGSSNHVDDQRQEPNAAGPYYIEISENDDIPMSSILPKGRTSGVSNEHVQAQNAESQGMDHLREHRPPV